MDDTFRENDFIEDQSLHARETRPSSEKTPKDITNHIRKEPIADGADELMNLRKFWESRYGRELTEFELQECRDNIAGFFSILVEWEGKTAGE
ncbi:MAG: hypothetical protein OXF05_02785 [Hyphomicrobiales bacterium]|nr:hypothetical protein [Hyphomicrobiales bacterium]